MTQWKPCAKPSRKPVSTGRHRPGVARRLQARHRGEDRGGTSRAGFGRSRSRPTFIQPPAGAQGGRDGAADLATALRQVAGDPAKAAQLARAAAAAVRPTDPPYHAFISVDPDPRAAADRHSDALLGCVFSIKDNIDLAGFRTTCSAMLADAPIATADAWIVKALKRAGAVCIGKNNMHEFALGATGASPMFGTTVNPWDHGRNVGGSSGGGASAVALRQVHLSLGTDSGGSVRMPASFTGITGFKPTPGVLPMDGVAGDLDPRLPRPVHADRRRPAHDLAGDRRGRAGAAEPPAAPGISQRTIHGGVHPVVWAQYQAALERLRGAGLDLVPISIEGFRPLPLHLHQHRLSRGRLLASRAAAQQARTIRPAYPRLICLASCGRRAITSTPSA